MTSCHPVCKALSCVLPSLLIVCLLSPFQALAATCDLVVDRFDDDPDADECTGTANDCSLRGALSQAQPGDVICLSTGTYLLGSELIIDKDVTLRGQGASSTFIEPTSGTVTRVLHVLDGAETTLHRVTVRNGVGLYTNGGGILNAGDLTLWDTAVTGCAITGGYLGGGISSNGTLTLENATIADNQAHSGGGISCSGGGLFIRNSRILENNVSMRGGGLHLEYVDPALIEDTVISGNSGDYAGGMYTDQNNLTINRCQISDNHSDGSGGGLYLFRSHARLLNTTVSGNSANATGGGIYLRDVLKSTSHVSFCTVTGNTADANANGTGDGGGVAVSFSNAPHGVAFKGNVIAGNHDLSPSGNVHPDISSVDGATVVSAGQNFIGDNTGSSYSFPEGNPNAQGDFVGTSASPRNPKLGPLANNGGPSLTHAILRGSPLANKGPSPCTDAKGNAVTTDQRGEPRPAGQTDIGAFEAEASAGVVPQILLLLQ